MQQHRHRRCMAGGSDGCGQVGTERDEAGEVVQVVWLFGDDPARGASRARGSELVNRLLVNGRARGSSAMGCGERCRHRGLHRGREVGLGGVEPLEQRRERRQRLRHPSRQRHRRLERGLHLASGSGRQLQRRPRLQSRQLLPAMLSPKQASPPSPWLPRLGVLWQRRLPTPTRRLSTLRLPPASTPSHQPWLHFLGRPRQN